jgi:Lon protease-like protein
MSQLGEDDLAFVPEQFSGWARLFPLPNLVLFPHVIQPLHVFEPRYVDLLRDALAGDRLIAMALLASGWEDDYEGRPPVAPIACLGRVITWQAQAGARYNVLLVGLRRVRLVRELPSERPFRAAQVEVLEDQYMTADSAHRPALHRELVTAFESMLPCIRDCEELFKQISISSMSLGTLTDVIGYALDLDLPTKQLLLAEPNVDRRATLLLSHLARASQDNLQPSLAAGFPPSFSIN